MDFETACNKILEVLDQCQEGIMILQAVTLIILNRRIGTVSKSLQNSSTISPAASPVLESQNSSTISPAASPVLESQKNVSDFPDRKKRKDLTKKRMQEALDLYFSDKLDEDLTAEEAKDVEAVQVFVDEVINGKCDLS